jgi:hypothetical protein
MKIHLNDKTGFFDRVRNMGKKYPEASKAIIVEFSNEAVKEGKEDITRIGVRGLTPVDKANLVSTLRTEVLPGKVSFVAGGQVGVGNPSVFVNYAYFVNNGTSKFQGRFYMEGAVNRALENDEALSRKILKSWISHG